MKRKAKRKTATKEANTRRVTLISNTAKKIRKRGEAWTNAIKRASKKLLLEGKLNSNDTKIKKREEHTYPVGLEGIKGQFKSGIIPEIKITYNKRRRIIGKANSPGQTVEIIKKLYRRSTIESHEQFLVLYLNRDNSIIGYHQNSKGGISSTVVDPRIIFAIALKSLATSIIIAHNHPSGNLQHSESDIKITKKIQKIGDFHDIKLLDHIIVTKDNYVSLSDKGFL